MPWLPEAMKDATSRDSPMGQPTGFGRYPPLAGWRRTRGTETSKYPQEKRTRVIPRVAASESGAAQTGAVEAAPG